MSEQELIKLAQEEPWKLMDIDKSLITGNVIDNIARHGVNLAKYILEGVDKHFLTKERLLRFLQYDEDIYEVVPDNLKNDTDILNSLLEAPHRLPHLLFRNKEAMRYLLNKLNTNTTWAVYNETASYLIIKDNKDEDGNEYYVYFMSAPIEEANEIIKNFVKTTATEPEDIAIDIAKELTYTTKFVPTKFTRTI